MLHCILKLYVVFCLLVPSFCANILGVFPNQDKSHYFIVDSVITELAKRGHNITVINNFPKSKALANFTDVALNDCDCDNNEKISLDRTCNIDEAFTRYSPIRTLQKIFRMCKLTDSLMNCDVVTKFLNSSSTFDLLLTEVWNSDIALVFANKFNVPFVSFCPTPLLPWAAERVGNPNNPSYFRLPYSDVPLDKNSTFYQRLFNTIYYVYFEVAHYISNWQTETKAERFFQNKIPLSETAKNTSLILTYSHFSINTPVPLLPNVIEIGGSQIKAVSPLPKELQKFLDESEHGVIFFSMGSLTKAHTMPEYKRNAFLNAFLKVPQRVVWKWGADLPGKTKKIHISEWFPQRDILAHPKVKLFISHGGALGLNEAVYEGVPVLGIPIYADQLTNLKVLQSNGAAEILSYLDISNETVLNKIQQVLGKSYSENMKKTSLICKDRPMSPLDTAVYWIEYVIRHKGAYHLRSAATDLPLYQYLLLDVIAFLFVSAFGVAFAMYYILRSCLRCCVGNPVQKSKKNN